MRPPLCAQGDPKSATKLEEATKTLQHKEAKLTSERTVVGCCCTAAVVARVWHNGWRSRNGGAW